MPSASIPAAIGIGVADAGATAAAIAPEAILGATGGAGIIGAGGAFSAATAATSGASILSTVGMVGAGLSGVTGLLGAEQSAKAQQESATYQAQVAANNEQIAKNDAGLAEGAGETAVEQSALKTRATEGAIKASQAASNIDVNSGSAVDVRSSADELGELDALTIRGNAQKQAYGYETAATGFGGQQSLATAQAAQAPIAGAISGAGSLLSGAAGVANQYSNWQRAAGSSSPTALF